MAKQIIILERQSGPRIAFRVAFWLAVPLVRQPFYANPNAVSVVKGITAPELQDIRDGKIVEQVEDYCESGVNPAETVVDVQTALIARLNAAQLALTNANQFSRYGTFYDGIGWTTGGA